MRITIAESGISEKFWTYAMDNAVQLHNSLPSRKHPGNISPFEARTGQPPDPSASAAFTLRFVWCAPRDLFAPRRMEEHPPLTRRSKDPRRRPLRHTHSPPLSHDQRWLASRAQAS
jgi:hypothetical protein